jgi:hypothetical protein
MPTEIFLPSCLSDTYKFLFPTLHFSKIHFYKGFPFPANAGSQHGLTLPDSTGLFGINVYLENGIDDPCSEDTFLTIAHELVHALQIQEGGAGLGLFNAWVVRYVTCAWSSFSSGRDNVFEREAYDYANGTTPLAQLRGCIEQFPQILPCDCSVVPWPGRDSSFLKELVARCPDIQKKAATASALDCAGTIGGLGGVLGTALLGAAIGAFFGPWGIVIGFAIGLVLGFFRGVAGLILGFLVALVGGIIAGIVSLIASLFDTIGGWFTGNGVGNISLIFSTDNGVTFPPENKVTFESSSEPPALAATLTQLFVGWVGTDNQLNVLAMPNSPPKTTFEHSNDDAGPGLAVAFGRVSIAWQDDDNHPHLMSAQLPGVSFANKVNLQDTLAGSAAPGLALGKDSGGVDLLYLAWIDDDDNKMFVKTSYDGVTWSERVALNKSSMDDGTPAIAFGNGRLYLAWVDDDDNRVHVTSYLPQPGGALLVGSDVTLNETSSNDAGPAVAFANGRLFLAWTDDNQRLQFEFTDDANTGAASWQAKQQLGNSSDNAGPAVAFISAGIVCVAWIDKGG